MVSKQEPILCHISRRISENPTKSNLVRKVFDGFINKPSNSISRVMIQNFKNYIIFIDKNYSNFSPDHKTGSSGTNTKGEKKDEGQLREVKPIETNDVILKFEPNPNIQNSCLRPLDYPISNCEPSVQLRSSSKSYHFQPNASNYKLKLEVNSETVELSYFLGHFLISVSETSFHSFQVSSQFKLINEHIYQIKEAQIIPRFKKGHLKLNYKSEKGEYDQKISGEKILYVDKNNNFRIEAIGPMKAAFRIAAENETWMILSLLDLKVFKSLHVLQTKKRSLWSYPLELTHGQELVFGGEEFRVLINGKN